DRRIDANKGERVVAVRIPVPQVDVLPVEEPAVVVSSGNFDAHTARPATAVGGVVAGGGVEAEAPQRQTTIDVDHPGVAVAGAPVPRKADLAEGQVHPVPLAGSALTETLLAQGN